MTSELNDALVAIASAQKAFCDEHAAVSVPSPPESKLRSGLSTEIRKFLGLPPGYRFSSPLVMWMCGSMNRY